MSSHDENVFEKCWEIIEQGFSQVFSDYGYLTTPLCVRDPEAYAAVTSIVFELCSITFTGSPKLVERLLTKIREQIKPHLKNTVLPKIEAGQKQGKLLETLNEQWKSYQRFKNWLGKLFCRLGDRNTEEEGPENSDVFDATQVTNSCFESIVLSPLLPLIREEVFNKFDDRVFGWDLRDIEAGPSLLSDTTHLLKAVSKPEFDIWETFQRWFVLTRQQTYHGMASEWVKTLCFEEFAFHISCYSRREHLAGLHFFDRKVGKTLHDETKRVFFGIYLPKVFQKSKELYKIWLKEGNANGLRIVNEALIRNGKLLREVTELFHVSFVEDVCSALRIESEPFLRNDDKVESPFHIYCATGRKPKYALQQKGHRQANIRNMFEAFGRIVDLLRSFSTAKRLKNKCERVVERYLHVPCTNCSLPKLLVSFCRSVLSNYGPPVETSSVFFCYSVVESFLQYAPELDRFQNAYCEDLFRRLMDNDISEMDRERIIISAFTSSDEQGSIRQGERMLLDYTESRSLFDLFVNSSFYIALREQVSVQSSFRVNLFRQGTVKCRTENLISVPHEIRVCHLSYEDFFRSQYETTKLEWNGMLGTVRIQTPLFSDSQRDITELELNVDQYSVLHLFQETNTLPLQNIWESVIMAPPESSDWERTVKVLNGVIQSMMFEGCPLLRKDPNTPIFSESDTITLNTGYVSDAAEVKVPKQLYHQTTPFRPSQKDFATESDTMKLVRVESVVMRAMKDLRRASREHLLGRLRQKCASGNGIDENLFQKALQGLMERDYIQREDGASVYFTYKI